MQKFLTYRDEQNFDDKEQKPDLNKRINTYEVNFEYCHSIITTKELQNIF